MGGWLWFVFPAAEAVVPRPNGFAANSARQAPARMTHRPIKTRRLKKADREADFFFMNDCTWMEFKCEARFVAELLLSPSTPFPVLWCDSPGFYSVRKHLASFFFHFFDLRITWIARIPKMRSRDLSIPTAL